MSEKQATPDLVGDRGQMGAFAQRVVRRVQRARQGFSPWVQRWLEPGRQVGGFAAQRRTALTAERTSAFVNRSQINVGHTTVQRSNAAVMRPIVVAQRAGAVIRRLEGSAPKYEYRSGGYGVSMGTEFTLAKPAVQASPREGEAGGAWSASEFSAMESSQGFAPAPPQRLATFDSKREPSLIERLQRRLSDAKVQQAGGQIAEASTSRPVGKETLSSDKTAAVRVQGKPVRPISRVEEVAPSVSPKEPAVSRVDMKRVRVGEPRPAGIQREEAPEEEVALKPLLQRQAEEEEEEVALKPLVRRQAEEEEEEVALKPLVQRQEEEEEEVALKPLRLPLTKPMSVKSLQRARRPGWGQAPMPLVSSRVGQGSSEVVAQRKVVDSARPVRRLSPLPLVQRRVSQEAGEIQRAEIPSATAVSSSDTSMEASSDAPQINLDDLARTVYSYVRRLFAVERERRSSIR
jgi:hypothetical protein